MLSEKKKNFTKKRSKRFYLQWLTCVHVRSMCCSAIILSYLIILVFLLYFIKYFNMFNIHAYHKDAKAITFFNLKKKWIEILFENGFVRIDIFFFFWFIHHFLLFLSTTLLMSKLNISFQIFERNFSLLLVCFKYFLFLFPFNLK